MKKHVSTGAGFLPSTVVNEDYIKQLITGGTTLWRGSGHVGAMVGPWFQHNYAGENPQGSQLETQESQAQPCLHFLQTY